jgi:lipid-binding SYLF domain-containing protein
MDQTRRSLLTGIAAIGGAGLLAPVLAPGRALAATGQQIATEAARALQHLYAAQPKTRTLGHRAKAVLVFPKIVKAGLIVGGQGGDGALLENGRARGFYNIAAASFGLQIGAQTFSYALFFLTDSALEHLESSDGWAVGTDPSVVVVDKGAAASLTSTTLSHDVYAVPFGQRGLMAGIGLEGSKITPIHPEG